MTTLPLRRSLYCLALGLTGLQAVAAPQAATQPAPVATRTDIRTYDSWEVTCSYGKDDKKIACSAALRVLQQDPAAPGQAPPKPRVIMVWSLTKGANGELLSSFETSTGVLIAPGIQLTLGSNTPRTVAYTACGPAACLAYAPMDATFVQQATAAQSVQVVVAHADGKSYTATFAPKGIDKAVAAVR